MSKRGRDTEFAKYYRIMARLKAKMAKENAIRAEETKHEKETDRDSKK